MTTSEVAARLECSPRHVQALCSRGELQAIRIGKRGWRISEQAVSDFSAHHANEPEAAPELAPGTPQRSASIYALPADYEPVFADLWGAR